MTTSEIILNIIVPILAAALSGVIGGLFTYLGVKRTIDYNNKIYSEEKCEKIRNRNTRSYLSYFCEITLRIVCSIVFSAL